MAGDDSRGMRELSVSFLSFSAESHSTMSLLRPFSATDLFRCAGYRRRSAHSRSFNNIKFASRRRLPL